MDLTDSWHPGAIRVASRWAVPLPLLPDEIFTSWLVRCALAHGIDPMSFAGSLWPKWRPWTFDIDRTIPDEHLHRLAFGSGSTPDHIRLSTLETAAQAITGHPIPPRASWPWIIPIGSRNRVHHRGTQYCPDCLAEDPVPYFRRHWRYAWHTVCIQHQRLLHNQCPHCLNPIQYHRLTLEQSSLRHCALCLMDLTVATILYEPPASTLIHFQLNADTNVRQACDDTTSQQRCVQWFSRARFFSGLVRHALKPSASFHSLQRFGQLVGFRQLNHDCPPVIIEQMSAQDRATLLANAQLLMVLSTPTLVDLLQKAGVTRQGLSIRGGPLPDSLSDVAEQLSSNTKLAKPKTQTSKQNSVLPQPKFQKVVEFRWAQLLKKMHRPAE